MGDKSICLFFGMIGHPVRASLLDAEFMSRHSNILKAKGQTSYFRAFRRLQLE